LATLNKSLSPSNSLFSIAGSITNSNGTLKLLNAGPSLVAGDTFTIFNQSVLNGVAMTIVSPGFTVKNNLAVDGSVMVTGVQPRPIITTTVEGNQLNLSWPSAWTGGVILQSQANPITTGLSTNWVTIAGTDASNTYSTTISKTNGCVFYRLTAP
jgi:hypothetical protein